MGGDEMKTSELTGAALDWAVAKIEQEWTDEDRWYNTIGYVDTGDVDDEPYYPSTNWAQGGPIIEREFIELTCTDEWKAFMRFQSNPCDEDGPTPLIAAMRCYVASKLGDDVDVPEELK
jgi:hypothetical protein